MFELVICIDLKFQVSNAAAENILHSACHKYMAQSLG